MQKCVITGNNKLDYIDSLQIKKIDWMFIIAFAIGILLHYDDWEARK